MRYYATLALGSGLLILACATGAVVDPLGPAGEPGGDGVDAASLPDSANGGGSYGSRDASHPPDTSPPPADSGPPADTGAPADSGTDTAPPPPPPVSNDCTGKYSSQVFDYFGFPVSYNNACDSYYSSGGHAGNPCTPGANDCAALNGTQGYSPFCCFKPATGSACYNDYQGKAQCIPQ